MMPALDQLLLFMNGSIAASILASATFVTALALAATTVARKSRASIRHVLLSATFAILLVLPLASLLAPPVRIPVPIAARLVTSAPLAPATTSIVTTRSADANVPVAPASSPFVWPSLSTTLLALWIAGAALFLLPVVVGLWQLRSLRRLGLPWPRGQSIARQLALDAGIRRPVEVLRHESMTGPVSCGAVRPAIVLPMDAEAWHEDDLGRASVHELEHVRRGDWVTQLLARAVCACYWFHPLVWFAWQQLTLEAERACDDAVLRRATTGLAAGAEATAYADQLVALAQRMLNGRRHSFPGLPAMANRNDLPARVTALLDNRQRRGPAGALWVALACAISAVLVTSMSPLRIVAAQAPPAASGQKFDVASVKACMDEPQTGGQRRQEYTVLSGRANIVCLTLERIIFFAYAGIGNMSDPLLNVSPADPSQLRGGPGWIRSDKFTVEATAEGNPDRTVMMGPMLRALLEDRFQLKIHRELEEAPLYALTVAKGGLKIQPLGEGGCTSFDTVKDLSREEILALSQGDKPICGNFFATGNGVSRTWSLGGESLSRFASQTLSSVLDRYVVDQTGVAGIFNIRLEFAPDESIRTGVFGGRAVNAPPPGTDAGPSIFTALEEQLGLKLEKTKGPRGFIVIDRAEKPSPN